MHKKQIQSPLTPMMEQFFRLKNEYPEFILFFRMGDFYEMFDKDAKITSQILGLALTKRQNFDMCGIPHHSKENYLYKLIQAGYKVAMCEQVEFIDSNNKKKFDRKVTELLTPGTFHSEHLNKNHQDRFLMSIYVEQKNIYFGLTDINTGKFLIGLTPFYEELASLVTKFNPSEIIFTKKQESLFIPYLEDYYCSVIEDNAIFTVQEDFLKNHFNIASLSALELYDTSLQKVVYANLTYIKNTLFKEIHHINKLDIITSKPYMYLNQNTIKNLEILDSLADSDQKKFSLYSHLNITKTYMGARYLKYLMVHPSIDPSIINHRLDFVDLFYHSPLLTETCRTILSQITDLERLISKISLKTATPKDIFALKLGLIGIKELKEFLNKQNHPLIQEKFYHLSTDISPVINYIENSLHPDPPIEIGDTPTIKDSYNTRLADLRKTAMQSYQILLDIETREQEKNNLPKLRIRYNKIIGYYIEVPKNAAKNVPDYFIRKQSLTNLERFTIEELISFEQTILQAKENLYQLEKELFQSLCQNILQHLNTLQTHIDFAIKIDIYTSLAKIATEHQYIKPKITLDNTLTINKGRHPVVEKHVSIFTPNSVQLNNTDNRLWLISGPNMAGKSTLLRQTALIVLMAHMGSFVPAGEASIPITDKIFTRIGASDNLAKGESTFLVEMSEASAILNFATEKSLIIMDEIGRGTSTQDGLALAWAIIEYLCHNTTIRGKTLFATHYHELSILEQQLWGVKNYRMMVKESQDNIIFLHKIEPGSAQKSYGIHVASIAGVPSPIIQRANHLISDWASGNSIIKIEKDSQSLQDTNKNDLESSYKEGLEKIQQQIIKLNIEKTTPIEALNLLNHLQNNILKYKKSRQPLEEEDILF